MSTIQPSSSNVKVTPVGPDGVVRCQCDAPATQFTSKTENNPGREFYRCTTTAKCGFWKWADEILPPPRNTPIISQQTQAHLKRPNSDVFGTQNTPSKRPRPSTDAQIPPETPSRTPREKRLAIIQEALSPHKQPATPSRTPQQRQRCLQDIQTALFHDSQLAISSQGSGKLTPYKPDRCAQEVNVNMSQPKVKAEETEDEYGRTSNEDEEDDPFAPNPNPDGLITPPPTGQQSTASRSQTAKGKGKLRSLDHLPEKLNTAESTQLQCLKSSLPADEVLLTAEEQRSLAKEFEQRYFAELSKNARLEVKIKSLERQIKELCEGGI